VRKPARPARGRRRHWLTLVSFVISVIIPSSFSGAYLALVAVDQYASKVGFSVRREDSSSAMDILGGLSSLSNSSSSDTDILYEFIQSQRLVADIDDELDLHAIWNKPSHDFAFALEQDASIEELVDYWNRMVRISYRAGSGLIEVEVLAFSAQDATMIAQTLFDRSSQMINELSDIARQDAIRYAREELDEALDRLKDARTVVTRFRNENQIVNPEIDIQTQAGLLGNLQNQQAQTLIEIDLLRGDASSTDPRLQQATRRLEVIENRIAAERMKLGVGGDGNGSTAFADLLGDYERLVVDREFAENSYVSALATYDGALAESRRKTRYLAAYMEPTRAQTPLYPKRLTLLMLIALFLFLIWSVMVLVAFSVRDRR
jgi:capsular polysaccharide transport system permease protein